jgi:hypothetical protein
VSVLDFDDQPSSIETVAGNDDEKDNNRVEGHIQGACGGTEEVVRDHKQGACGGTEVGVIDHVLSACGGTEDGAVDNCKEKENARHRESVDEYKSEKGNIRCLIIVFTFKVQTCLKHCLENTLKVCFVL